MVITSQWINAQKHYNLCKWLVSRDRDTLSLAAESCCLHIQLQYLMAFDPNSEFLGCFSLPWHVFFTLCVVNHCVWQVWALLPLITISYSWHNPMGTRHVGSNILKESQQGFFSIGVVGCAVSQFRQLVFMFIVLFYCYLWELHGLVGVFTVVTWHSFIDKAWTNSSAPHTYFLQLLLYLESGLLCTVPAVDTLLIFQIFHH